MEALSQPHISTDSSTGWPIGDKDEYKDKDNDKYKDIETTSHKHGLFHRLALGDSDIDKDIELTSHAFSTGWPPPTSW